MPTAITKKIIGLPRMTTLPGLRREFIPEFVKRLAMIKDVHVWIEPEYGSDLGFFEREYLKSGKNVFLAKKEKIFSEADIVILRASPEIEDISLMHPGQILVSKLHFPTY